jgi:hypothetical protein
MILENEFEYQMTIKEGFSSQLYIDASRKFDWPIHKISMKTGSKYVSCKDDVYHHKNQIINLELLDRDSNSFPNIFRTEPNVILQFEGAVVFKELHSND